VEQAGERGEILLVFESAERERAQRDLVEGRRWNELKAT
jgi:hypothetical protein